MRVASIIAAGTSLLSAAVSAADINVISTQATQEAYLELVAQFEKASGHKVKTCSTERSTFRSGSPTASPTTSSSWQARRSTSRSSSEGALAGSRVDLAKSGTGLAVRKGARKPDIGSADALKKTLLAAKSIGYSTGPSGLYMLSVFEKLGIADQVKGKLKQTPPAYSSAR